MDRAVIRDVHALKEAVQSNAAEYHHSLPLIRQETGVVMRRKKALFDFVLEYDIKDCLLMGALTHSSTLMTGGTDLGKTTLARLVMNALFGEEDKGWHRIDVDIDFGRDTVTDLNFGVLTEGKRASGEGDGGSGRFYNMAPYLSLPGLITDEINRSHAKLVNKLIHVFDKDLSLPDGQRVKIGYPYGNGRYYQFQISAINEGEEYAGTFDMDKALRRRAIIEIPMDIFQATPHDRERIRKSRSKEIQLRNRNNAVETVVGVYSRLESLPLHPNASLFLAYLESFDYCEHSLTRSKSSVTSKGGSVYHVCTRPVKGADVVCHFIRSFEDDLCPYIRAVTPGVSKNLISVAKGLALLRAVKVAEMLHLCLVDGVTEQPLSFRLSDRKSLVAAMQEYTQKKFEGKDLARAAFDAYASGLEVAVEDITSLFGFVGYSKVGLSPPWIAKYYQGNRFEAVSSFIKQAREKFKEGVAKLDYVDVTGSVRSGLGDSATWKSFMSYCTSQNPWLLQAMRPVIERQERERITMEDVKYLHE